MPVTPPKKKKAKPSKASSKSTKKPKPKKPTDMELAAPEEIIMGRPAKYRPEYCAMLVEHMGEAYPYETFASLLGVHRGTLYRWEKAYPDFRDAKKVGNEARYKRLIDIGKRIALGGKGNASVWIFMMKNLEGWKNELEVKGSLTLSPHEYLMGLAEKAEGDPDILDAEEVD